ncbi:hypothetical protein [Arthrobacter sp.]|uniref:zinc finger domain-containing protein n=1 Tax=Arthrobacter sp. TaxID=1667 RepID=UPI003A8F8EE8
MTSNPSENLDSDNQGKESLRLAQVIALFDDLLAQTHALETALYDCPEPLNLKSSLRMLTEASSSLLSAKNELEQVDQIVQQRLSISGRFGSDRVSGEPRDIAAGELLSPKQIITLFDIGQHRPEYPQILLADHLQTVEGTRPTAMVKAQHQAKKEQQLHREALEEKAKDLIEDVESRTCPTCSAIAGQFCRTSSGRIAETPHRPRVKLSDIAVENPEVATHMTRINEASMEYFSKRDVR